MDNKELITELIKGTDFEVMTNTRILTNRKRVRTPIEVLNCLLGGGIPLGIVAHCFGEPRGGKSTLFYQTMGIFQEMYSEGIAVIIDMESSADPNRLRALGVNYDEVVRLPATSIEGGFLALMKLLDNKENNPALKDVPIFVIWDTISKGLATDNQTQSRVAAMDRARIIKNYMGELQKSIEKHDFFLGLINQIIYKTDFYGNTKVGAGGGIALQHDNQLSLFVELNSDVYNDYNMLIKRVGKIWVDKSKISPEISDIMYHMDVTRGAYILEEDSFIDTMINIGFIDSGKAWVKMKVTYNHEFSDDLVKSIMDAYEVNIDKSWRQGDLFIEMTTTPYMYRIMQHMYMNLIESQFALQAEVIRDYHLEIADRLKDQCVQDGVFNSEVEVAYNKVTARISKKLENNETIKDNENLESEEIVNE